MYDRSSTADGMDKARLDLFARKKRPYEDIPPMRATLIQHTKRAAYQAGCVWAHAILRQPGTENPAEWEWDGRRLARNGKSSGQPIFPLQRVMSCSLSVAASLDAMSGSNAAGLVLHAQPCAVANVKCSLSFIMCAVVSSDMKRNLTVFC